MRKPKTGWGLFASKDIRKGDVCCSYEGKKVPMEHLLSGYGNKDYVIMAIKNHNDDGVRLHG